jgi:hypothetical protein
MFNNGYVKLHRKVLDSGILKHAAAWQVFGHVLLSCVWSRQQVDGVNLEPGELLSTCQEIADKLDLTYKQTRMGIDFLEKRGTMGKQLAKFRASGRAGEKSIYSLLNWKIYAGMENEGMPKGNRKPINRARHGQAVGKPSINREEGEERNRAHARQDKPITHISVSLKAQLPELPAGFDTWPVVDQVAHWSKIGN